MGIRYNKINKYLYEFYTDNYDFDRALDYIHHLEKEGVPFMAPACSTIRSGNYFGRNFDFFYSELIDFVIHVPRAGDRYASIAVGCTVGECTPESIADGICAPICNIIPFYSWDGINEKGVVFCTNVVPSIDLDKQTTGTNPCGEELPSIFIGREILDHAGSACEAIEILKSRNIITPSIVILRMTNDLHFMIADEKETYIVEFVDNKLVVKKDAPLMTNFYVTTPMKPHSCGLERYNILKENYEKAGKDIDSMSLLMKDVHYRQAYDLSMEPFWYSEHLAYGISEGVDITVFNMHKYEDLIRDHVKDVSFDKRGLLGAPWHSMHSSIYDIPNRRLRLFAQEKYNEFYEFRLDKETYTTGKVELLI